MRERRQTGQAAVELVAVLPFVAAALLCLLQVVLAAHAAWAAEQAAQSAARAQAVAGTELRAAVRRALPDHLERDLRVRARGDGSVAVRVALPVVLRPLDLGTFTASARFEPQA